MLELDGIRGAAILGVLCSHGVGLTGIFRRTPDASLADNLLAFVMVPLWGGVDLFFALSGFLITGILLRTKNRDHYFSSFYTRRALRIFPIYYLALTLSIVIGHFSATFANALPPSASWKFAYFIYLQNWPFFWHGAKVMGGVWAAYWSLAIEEQFYFAWPLVIFFLSEKKIAYICLLGFAAALPLRIFLYDHLFGNNFGLAQITSSRVDGLFAGAGCAIYMFKRKRPVPMPWIIALASAGTAIMVYILLFHPAELVSTGKWITTWGISGFALLSASLVAISQHHIPRIDHVLTLTWLRALGKYSYGIYVYHVLLFLPLSWYLRSPAGSWVRLNFPERVLFMLFEVIAVIIAAKISYDLFEVRILRMKSRFKAG